MIITPCPHGLEDVLGKSVGYRTPGVHVSALYGALYKRLDPKRFTGDMPDPVRLEAGLSFENVVEDELRRRLSAFRPGEIVSPEGIIMSPDLIVFNGSVRTGEIKLTWMSSREMPMERANGVPPQFQHWITQIMSYAHILENPLAKLIGYFVNGTYPRGAPAPQILAWELEFTARELRDNWTMLTKFGHEIGLLRGGRVISPEEYAQHGK